MKISLDDFGTAYSSLSYLHSFPLHKVKIDQSFLRGLGDDERRVTLLRAMTRLSAQLGLHVVVEGSRPRSSSNCLPLRTVSTKFKGTCLAGPCQHPTCVRCFTRLMLLLPRRPHGRHRSGKMWREAKVPTPQICFVFGETRN